MDIEYLTAEVINLILNTHPREWERFLLTNAKNELVEQKRPAQVFATLEAKLRPLALRNNLTPAVADFYFVLTQNPASKVPTKPHKLTTPADTAFLERAIFAGGCFWCMVEPFETHPGIVSVLSGYTGGQLENPSYDQVSSGTSGHVEAVEILFDTRVVTYAELLELYWGITDPTDAFGQFQDRGDQYRPIIFVTSPTQKKLAEQAKQALIASEQYTKPIVTEILAATSFWPAEDYHQQFYKKQPARYKAVERTRKQFLAMQKLGRTMHGFFK